MFLIIMIIIVSIIYFKLPDETRENMGVIYILFAIAAIAIANTILNLIISTPFLLFGTIALIIGVTTFIIYMSLKAKRNAHINQDEDTSHFDNPLRPETKQTRVDNPFPTAPEANEKQKNKHCPYCGIDFGSYLPTCPNCSAPALKKPYNIDTKINIINISDIMDEINEVTEKPPKIQIQTFSGNLLDIKPILSNERFVSCYPFDNSSLRENHCIKKYTVIDFETANMYPDSVCQIAIVEVVDDEITYSKSYLIRPPYNDFRNKEIHGISRKDVKNSPTFEELWPTIEPFIKNKFVAAYNAKFDCGCLKATLENFNIPVPDYAVFDIWETARNYWYDENWPNRKLVTVAKKLNIEHNPHDALSDAIAAAKVQILANKEQPFKNRITFNFKNDELLHEMQISLMSAPELYRKGLSLGSKITSANKSDYEEVLFYYDLAIKHGFDNANLYKHYGEILERCNELDDAIKFYQKALSLNDKIGLKKKLQKLLN